MSSTVVAIQDAELLLDLTEANLLSLVFGLTLPFATTDLLWRDLGGSCQRALTPFRTARKLVVEPTDVAAQQQAIALQQAQPGLSLAESSVCCLAQARNWPMLASCQSLLARCYIPQCPLYDLGWLLNQVRDQAQLSRAAALHTVRQLVAVNPRLRVTCAVLVRHWQ